MRWRVSSLIKELPFKARDTVEVDTPAILAMSTIWIFLLSASALAMDLTSIPLVMLASIRNECNRLKKSNFHETNVVLAASL
jgi:hypothetical protein